MVGVVFFLSKPFGNKETKETEKFTILTGKPRNNVRILIYRTWPIPSKKTRLAS